jgi:S1-C subfamily serine protease
MSDAHRYATGLFQRVSRTSKQQSNINARLLLKGFGYAKRTERIVATIDAHLARVGLISDLTADYPASLDESVSVRLRSDAPAATAVAVSTAAVAPPPAPVARSSYDWTSIAAATVAATVVVSTADGHGSGFIVHPAGLVVTAEHVIRGDNGLLREVTITLAPETAQEQQLTATVFRAHRALDFALLWLPPSSTPYPTLPIGRAAALVHAQEVLAVGSPAGLHNTVSRGIIANPRKVQRGIEFIQSDAAVDPGNSGGPLVAADGAVGMNIFIHTQAAAGKFAVPLDYFTDEIAAAVARGRDSCLNASFCPACGNHDQARDWYCSACGVHPNPPPISN